MINSTILKRFKDLGITVYEAKCYISLLEKDSLTVPEISRIAKIARPNAYEALEKLLVKGFCIFKPGKTKRYAAADPSFLKDKISSQINNELDTELNENVEVFRENLKKKELEILERKRAVGESVNKIVDELTPSYKNRRSNDSPLEYIEIIKDLYQIRKKYLQLCREAKEEVLSFSKPPYGSPRKGLEEQIRQKPPQGRRTRAVYEIPKEKREIEWLFKCINISVSQGEEVRVIKELPMKMAIFDSRIVMLLLEDPVTKQPSLTTQIIRHRSLAKGLKMLFEMLWEQAEDFHILQD